MKTRVWIDEPFGMEPAILVGESSRFNCVRVRTTNGIETININFVLDFWGNPLKGQKA